MQVYCLGSPISLVMQAKDTAYLNVSTMAAIQATWGNRINGACCGYYGHAGIKWLEYLTSDKDVVMQQAQKLLDSFIGAAHPSKKERTS